MISVRGARPDDVWMVYEWANDPVSRSMSFDGNEIDREAHAEWFKRKLEGSVFFIGIEDDGDPVGMVRFTVQGSSAEMYVAIAPHARGKRLATPMIDAAVAALVERHGIVSIGADIRSENAASIRMCLRSGFVDEGDHVVRGQPAKRLVWRASLNRL